MSFAANQARLALLISMEYDINLEMMFLMHHKIYLGKAVSTITNMKVEYDQNSEADRYLQAKISQLNEAEKVLEVKLDQIRKRQEAIKTEREGLSKVIIENAQRTFKAWSN